MSINRCDGIAGSGMVYAIRKDSHYYGPGRRTIVLFKGCSFSCWWCPNPEVKSHGPELRLLEGRCVRCGACINTCSIEAAREDDVPENGKHFTVNREICIVCGACISGCAGHAREMVGRFMSVEEVMEQIEPNVPLFIQSGGGVTFAGGEPLMQIGFLGQLLKACKGLGIHTSIDTSGYMPWEFLDRVRSMVDLFLFELKLMDEERHQEFTGLPNGLILDNLKMLSQLGHRIILRVPIIPGISDDTENLDALLHFASRLPHLESTEFIPYRPAAKEKYESLGIPYHFTSQTGREVEQLSDLLQQFHANGLSAAIVDADQAEQAI